MKLVKGQRVWVANRNGTKETTVKSSGSKYITVHLDDRIKYDAESLNEVNGCGHSSMLIVDIDKYREEVYYKGMISRLHLLNWDIDRALLDKVINILGMSGAKK